MTRPAAEMLNGFYLVPPRVERKDLAEEAEYVFLGALSSYDVGQTEVTFDCMRACACATGWCPLCGIEALRTARGAARGTAGAGQGRHRRSRGGGERFAALCRFVQGSLSEYENRVWWAYVAGHRCRRSRRHFGKDEKSVHNAVYRIRRKLRCRPGDEDGGMMRSSV